MNTSNNVKKSDVAKTEPLSNIGGKQFVFSIIMAVYNVEPYISEAIESIINQTLDFKENVQIILVDDGSEDGSGRICDQYRDQYPDNIVAIHKVNEGQAKARLVGVEKAIGKYVNFLDPDDKLSVETLENVYKFYLEHEDEVDVVSIPLFFFGALHGAHPLNNKFKTTRVLDLTREWKNAQLSLASSFIRNDALCEFGADSEIATAEDAIELVKILTRKQKIGVVKEARYHYRRRNDSTLGKVQDSPAWYNVYLSHFSEWALRYCQEKLGYIPKFIQYTVLYDLQWKLRPQEIPQGVLTEEEERQYQEKLFSLAKFFDDDVILGQSSIYCEHKLYLLCKKYGKAPHFIFDHTQNAYLLAYEDIVWNPSAFSLTIHHLDIDQDGIFIEYTQVLPDVGLPCPVFYINASGTLFPSEVQAYDNGIYSAGVRVGQRVVLRAHIPFPSDLSSCVLTFVTTYGDICINQTAIRHAKYSPLVSDVKNTHFYKNGVMFVPTRLGIKATHMSRQDARKKELAFCKSLFKGKDIAGKKAALIRLLTFYARTKKKKQIWLICDKANRADDNGEAFFCYLQEKKPSNIDSYFLVDKASPDYNRLKKVGKVVPYLSRKHKMLYLMADYVISAYSHDEINNPFFKYKKYYADLMQDCQYVFLQHGIIKDDLSRGLNRFHKNIRLFICSTVAETESIINNPKYGYSVNEVVMTGLPRYDRLYHDEKNEIVIMPTWRRSLFGDYHAEKSQWDLKPGFTESPFFCFYNSLLNDERLLSVARKYGFTINFVPHPVLFPYVDRFQVPDEVHLWGETVTYRDMFARNKLLLTDFSSVAFDFAYLRKPVLYAHFDTNHYEEGYFNYEQDGFGEVEYDLDNTVTRIIEYMESDCHLKDKYRERIDNFFAFHDDNNCQRVFEAIIASEE